METNEPAPEGGRACEECGDEITRRAGSKYCSVPCQRRGSGRDWRKKNRDRWVKDKARVKAQKKAGNAVGIRSQKSKMLNGAKSRASKKGIPFNLTREDFEIPEVCPVLGIDILLGTDFANRDQAPSLDRVVPSLGYVKGNVIVTSFRANRIKNDATVTELEQVATFYRNHMSKNWMVPDGPE